MKIIAYFYIKQPGFDYKSAEVLFDFLNNFSPEYSPEQFNYIEPINNKYDPRNFKLAAQMLEMWGNIYLKRTKPYYLFGISSGHPIQDRWYFEFEKPFFSDNDKNEVLIQFFQNLAKLFPPLLISIALESDFDKKHTLVDENGVTQGTKGAILSPGEGLPGIYWCTMFGSELVKYFGKSKLLQLNNIEAREIDDDFIIIKTYETPTENDEKWRREKELAVVNELGYDYFFDIDYYSKSKRPRRRKMIPGVTKK